MRFPGVLQLLKCQPLNRSSRHGFNILPMSVSSPLSMWLDCRHIFSDSTGNSRSPRNIPFALDTSLAMQWPDCTNKSPGTSSVDGTSFDGLRLIECMALTFTGILNTMEKMNAGVK